MPTGTKSGTVAAHPCPAATARRSWALMGAHEGEGASAEADGRGEGGASSSEFSSKECGLWYTQQHLLFFLHRSSLSSTSSAQRTRCRRRGLSLRRSEVGGSSVTVSVMVDGAAPSKTTSMPAAAGQTRVVGTLAVEKLKSYLSRRLSSSPPSLTL